MVLKSSIRIPNQPILVAGLNSCKWLSFGCKVETIDIEVARDRISRNVIPIVCHAPTAARRLRTAPFPALDVLELFAFVHPAKFLLPTPIGIAEALGLTLPNSLESAAASLADSVRALLGQLHEMRSVNEDITAIATAMNSANWPWGSVVLSALGLPEGTHSIAARQSLNVWTHLPEWEEGPPSPEPDNQIISPNETLTRLGDLLGNGAEKRQGQKDFAETCTAAFQPRENHGEPHLVVAEAGTGIGKTIGYVAPASLWAEKNKGTVWISTFTRNLQRQLDAELGRLFPNQVEKQSRVVIRKGRENYLCLLNLSDAVSRLTTKDNSNAIGLGLLARWASKTRDGDMIGGDFPAWLIDILGAHLTINMTDKLGECVYSACDHYRKCFIERNVRRAPAADIVVANHALVMILAVLGNEENGVTPLRYIFDEGHHLFDAADNAFSTHLSGSETADLRRWLIGPEANQGGTRKRGRGLRDRAHDIVSGDERAEELLDEILKTAKELPGSGWNQRLDNGIPLGAVENFLYFVRQQTYARNKDAIGSYNIETNALPTVKGLLNAAINLENALAVLEKPLVTLRKRLNDRLDTEAKELDTAARARILGLSQSILRRCCQPLATWRSMLNDLSDETPETFVDWFEISKLNGRETDVGFFRHWLDPTIPLADSVFRSAHGVLVTSASLRDHGFKDTDDGWLNAESRIGVNHIISHKVRATHPSPFKHADNTVVLIIQDVDRNNANQVASAYRELFLAAGGGGLGLFTAIHRLRAVYDKIARTLESQNLTLLAQHVDSLDIGSLIDIFRADENSCLFGTDAVRDGIDVPGQSLRLIVFDRVPWPRPTLLHQARKKAFGGRDYDEILTRLKLKQAYGRLLRQQEDRGVLVMLDRGLPTRLLNAFPSGVECKRVGLTEALNHIPAFLGTKGSA